jgi:site-specific DNA recombinase
MRAARYARLSRNRQGLSTNTQVQLDECAHYIEDEHWTLAVTHADDDLSASRYSTKPRPGYAALLADIKAGRVEVIVCTEMPRLYRRLEEWLELIKLAETTSLKRIETTDGMTYDLSTGEGVHQAVGAINNAVLESRKISDRTRRKQAVNARNGLSHGGRRAFGYLPGNSQLNEPEAEVLREMGRRLLAGHSFKEIAYWLNAEGHRTTEGKLWHTVTVRNTLRRVRYGGIREHRGAHYPAQWPPVFDAETWERMQLVIRSNAQKYSGRPKARKYLLTGLVFCGKCGLPLNGATKRDHPGRPLRRTYHCRVTGDTQKARGCGGIVRNADALEHFTREALMYRLDTPKLAELLKQGEDSDALRTLLERRSAQQARINEILDDYATNQITRAERNRLKPRAEDALAVIEGEISKLNSRRLALVIPAGQSLQQAWDASESDAWRREVLGLFIDKIVVKPGVSKPRYHQWRFDVELVEIAWKR